jgi:hypothetical protein
MRPELSQIKNIAVVMRENRSFGICPAIQRRIVNLSGALTKFMRANIVRA